MTIRVGFTALVVLASTLAGVSGPPPAGAQDGPAPSGDGAAHHVIVELAPGADLDASLAALSPGDPAGSLELFATGAGAADGRPPEAVVDRVGADGTWVALEVDDAGLAALEASPAVVEVQPNREVALSTSQSVPAIGASVPATRGVDGTGTTVVVIDTGVDTTHPAFDGALVAEACFSEDCTSGPITSGAPCDVSESQFCYHGTHVAGIAVGRDAPRGVAPAANLVAVRIFDSRPDGSVRSRESELIAAMEWVRDNHESWPGDTVAVNLSLGFPGAEVSGHCDFLPSPLVGIVRDLRDEGVMTVAATGNAPAGGAAYANAVQPPACFSDATPVGASYSNGTLAGFGHRSSVVDLVAPGANSPGAGIVSARVGGGTTTLDGTSMSAPHVAGAVALLREVEPALGVDELERRLRDSGRPVEDPALPGRTFAMVRVDRALCDVPRRVGCAQATAGDRRATVSWGTLASLDHGVVAHRVTADDGSAPVVVPVGTTSTTFTGLQNERRYTFVVEALGEVDGSDVVLATATSNVVVPKAPAGPHGFTDVAPAAFYQPGVQWARAEGVTTGVGGSTSFVPSGTVTRAEIVTFLWRLVDAPAGAPAHGFPDVRAGVYYDAPVAWARANGVTTGFGGTGRFEPDLPVTRGELVTFLWRTVGRPTGYLGHGFTDTIPGAYYDQAVRWAAFHGVTTGVGGSDRFAPNAPVTRGEAVTFMRRAAADPAVWSAGSPVPSTVVF